MVLTTAPRTLDAQEVPCSAQHCCINVLYEIHTEINKGDLWKVPVVHAGNNAAECLSCSNSLDLISILSIVATFRPDSIRCLVAQLAPSAPPYECKQGAAH